MEKNILETEPASKIFITLLKHPEGIHVFEMRTIIYPESESTSRIYTTLKTLEDLKLVDSRTEKIEPRAKKKRKEIKQEKKTYTINFASLVDFIDKELLPENNKLNENEKKELKIILEDERTLDFFLSAIKETDTFLQSLTCFLNHFSRYELIIRETFPPKALEGFKKFIMRAPINPYQKKGYAFTFECSSKLSKPLLDKLSSIESLLPELTKYTFGSIKEILSYGKVIKKMFKF